jgi:periplasmic protein TonB
MPDFLRRLRREQWAGLLFVLVLHAVVLVALWRMHVISMSALPDTLMVEFINPEQTAPPRLPRSEPPKAVKPEPVKPPEPQQLVAEAPVVKPDEPVAYAPPAPTAPVVVAPPPPAPSMPPQPVVLSNELSVTCPNRTPPEYPRLSMRMNEEGRVVLKVELGEDGSIASVQVKASSGFARLDSAALGAVKTWRCKPVVRNGEPVRATALQPFNFTLEGG